MKRPILLDGAMGTTLNGRGLQKGTFPEEVNITHPAAVVETHRLYVEAGSKIIYTCTFGVNGLKAKRSNYAVGEGIKAAVAYARAACAAVTRVALDIGSLGELLEPYGELDRERAHELFCEIARAGGGADLAVIETMSDLREALTALEAVKSVFDKPVFVTMTFRAGGRTLMGDSPAEIVRELSAAGADALGLNCSLGPREALPIVCEIRELSALPVAVKPNAGMPDPKTGLYRLGPEEFAELMLPVFELGIDYAGGCCGTEPGHIAALSGLLMNRPY